MNAIVHAGLLLVAANVFMTFAGYAQHENLGGRPWFVAARRICAAVRFVFRDS
jgi:uncharacterized protein (DUF486 family)